MTQAGEAPHQRHYAFQEASRECTYCDRPVIGKGHDHHMVDPDCPSTVYKLPFCGWSHCLLWVAHGPKEKAPPS